MGEHGRRFVEVRSADGTTLVAEVTGRGSPLLLVHGTSVAREDWMALPQLLAAEHTVWHYDRRGRGDSGDAEAYQLEREIDDILAVLAVVGQPAHLLGHSFGALCALKAASAGAALLSLVLYEPPIHVNRVAEAVQQASTQLRTGNRDGALATFLSDIAGEPGEEVELSRADAAAWNVRAERMDTVVREMNALAQLAWDPLDYQSVKVPVLYIAGGLTEGSVYPRSEDIAEALPHVSLVTIPDQGHVAFAYDPEGFADIVLRFTRQP